MISIGLFVAAVCLWFGVDAQRLASVFAAIQGKVSPRQAIAGVLAVAAVAMLAWPHAADDQPTPAPDSGPLVLDGVFLGLTASEDASLVGAMCSELADEIEADGQDKDPRWKTGVQVDELRRLARVMRCRGISIGDRQPAARDAIAKHLEQVVGVDGGDLTPETRAAWVTGLRDVGRAASDAAQ